MLEMVEQEGRYIMKQPHRPAQDLSYIGGQTFVRLNCCYLSFLLGAAKLTPNTHTWLPEVGDGLKEELWVPGYQTILGRHTSGRNGAG